MFFLSFFFCVLLSVLCLVPRIISDKLIFLRKFLRPVQPRDRRECATGWVGDAKKDGKVHSFPWRVRTSRWESDTKVLLLPFARAVLFAISPSL